MNGGASLALPRIVQREILDDLAADDPRAQRSRRDLLRVHRAMGTRAILRKALRRLALSRQPEGEPLRILELGAGDGRLMLAIARDLAPRWPRVELTLLDRQPLVAPATIAAFAELGWHATGKVADALEWAKDGGGVDQGAADTGTSAERQRPPARAGACLSPSDRRSQHTHRPWHLIVSTLFLHHFSGAQVAALLSAISASSERFLACEPRRARLALAGSHLLGALGAGPVTREDAVLSVHAGFRANELSDLWPARDTNWQLAEYPAGLFSHCLTAERWDVAQRRRPTR